MRKSHKPRLSGYTEHQIIDHYTTHKYLSYYTTHNQIYGRKSRNSTNCRDIATINFTNFNSIATINAITTKCNAFTNQNEMNHIFPRILTTIKYLSNVYVPMKLNCHYEIDNYLRKQMSTQYLFPNNEPTNYIKNTIHTTTFYANFRNSTSCRIFDEVTTCQKL